MNVQFKTIRKFGDKVYILSEITDYDERLPMVLSATTNEGLGIPSDTFAFTNLDSFLDLEAVLFDGSLTTSSTALSGMRSRTLESVRYFVVVLPWLSVKRFVLDFRAIDSMGYTISSCIKKLELNSVVLSDALTSRFFDDEGDLIHSLDGRYIHDRIQVSFTRAVEDQEMVLVTAEVDLPFHEESVIEFDFLDERGHRLFIDPFVIEDSVTHAVDFGSFERRHMVVTFSISREQDGVCFCATDVAGSVLPGFGMLGYESKEQLLEEFYEKTTSAYEDENYNSWFKEKHAVDLPTMLQQVSCRFDYEPLISVICLLDDTPVHHLFELISSMRVQTYGRWELILVNVSEYRQSIVDIVNAFKDDRIFFSTMDADTEHRFSVGFAAAEGDFVTVIRASDKLASDALFEIVRCANENPDCDLFYSDVDTIDAEGIHTKPIFKPDFSPELLRSYNYIKGFVAARKTLVDDFCDVEGVFGSALEYDLILRISEKARNVYHVPRVLYHLRYATDSYFGYYSQQSQEAGRIALINHCKRKGIKAEILSMDKPFRYHVAYIADTYQKVSLVVPSLGDMKVLKRCVSNLSNMPTYKNYEIVVVDASRTPDLEPYYAELEETFDKVAVLRWDKEFNLAKIANFAAQHTQSDFLLYMTEDAKIISDDFIKVMVGYCQCSEVGIVGPKQLYSDGTVENAGIAIGGNKVINTFSRYMPSNWEGYQGRANLPQNVSAVSGDCMLIRRKTFDEVGGFTEDFSLSYADVDFCLKAAEKGYYTVYTPYAVSSHFKSVSRARNYSKALRIVIRREAALLEHLWSKYYVEGDRFYNKNLDANSPYFALEHYGANEE